MWDIIMFIINVILALISTYGAVKSTMAHKKVELLNHSNNILICKDEVYKIEGQLNDIIDCLMKIENASRKSSMERGRNFEKKILESKGKIKFSLIEIRKHSTSEEVQYIMKLLDGNMEAYIDSIDKTMIEPGNNCLKQVYYNYYDKIVKLETYLKKCEEELRKH